MSNNIVTINGDEEYFVEDKEVIDRIRNVLRENAIKVKQGGMTALGDELIVEIEGTSSLHGKLSDKNQDKENEDQS